MEADDVKKVPVALNEDQAENMYHLDLEMQFTAAELSEAVDIQQLILKFLERHDITVTAQDFCVARSNGTVESILEEGENEADTALRKLTANKGNKLWIEHLEQQLKLAKSLR